MGLVTTPAFDAEVTDVLRREGWGAFTDDPDDLGDATRWGVAQKTLGKWRVTQGQAEAVADVTAQDVAELTKDEALEIYWHMFWRVIDGDGLAERAPGVASMVFDAAVLFGAFTAATMLQAVLNAFRPSDDPIAVDGQIGPQTLGAVTPENEDGVIVHMAAERARRHNWRVAEDHKKAKATGRPARQWKFLDGWLARTEEVKATALARAATAREARAKAAAEAELAAKQAAEAKAAPDPVAAALAQPAPPAPADPNPRVVAFPAPPAPDHAANEPEPDDDAERAAMKAEEPAPVTVHPVRVVHKDPEPDAADHAATGGVILAAVGAAAVLTGVPVTEAEVQALLTLGGAFAAGAGALAGLVFGPVRRARRRRSPVRSSVARN